MKLKELEDLLIQHLQESEGIKTRLANVDSKINWVIGLIASLFVVLVVKAMRG